jgi:PhzF family phenazine biosynthesis protein
VKPLAFRILNVFARQGRLTGNPLCVFEDARGLDEATMQALARQFNLSETTFILPAGSGGTARARIFTPAYEMPFAGHPTLGTAHVVRSLTGCGDAVKLELNVGIIPVAANGDRWTLVAKVPRIREMGTASRALVAAALGLDKEDLLERPLWVNAGTEQLIVPVGDAAAVARAKPVAEAFFGLKSDDPPAKVYVFADAGDEARSVSARFFFPVGNAILEDPATGSACANLGGWFQEMRRGADVERVVSQGEAVNRPSSLHLAVKSGAIFVGGDVVELGRGTIEL